MCELFFVNIFTKFVLVLICLFLSLLFFFFLLKKGACFYFVLTFFYFFFSFLCHHIISFLYHFFIPFLYVSSCKLFLFHFVVVRFLSIFHKCIEITEICKCMYVFIYLCVRVCLFVCEFEIIRWSTQQTFLFNRHKRMIRNGCTKEKSEFRKRNKRKQ